MIDRLVHYAEVVALKGDSYRLKDRDLGRVPAATTEEPRPTKGSIFYRRQGLFSPAVDRFQPAAGIDVIDAWRDPSPA